MIDIYRDRLGIPHVRAQTMPDAFYGQGYAMAQDRLFHMDWYRRLAWGTWAECAGPAAVAQDRLMRRFGLGVTARADYERAKPGTRAMLDAFAAGVNAYIKEGNRSEEHRLLGMDMAPWQPWDGLACYKVRHVVMGVWEAKLFRAKVLRACGARAVRQLYPGPQKGERIILPPGADYAGAAADALAELEAALQWLPEGTDGGSNNWVVAGSRTALGKPLLAGDPHRPVEVPNIYIQMHIACPEFDALGLAFPGVPGFPHFGHNARVAWCVTHTGADTQDLYIEKFDAEGRYLFRGEWRQPEVRTETIRVRGGEPVEDRVVITHHGPVIAGDPTSGHAFAARWTATLPDNDGADLVLDALYARSCQEMDALMRAWVDPVNSFLTADVEGNIAFRTRGRLPVRHRLNAWLPVPGWTGEHEWQGYVPFEELPAVMNPPEGWVATANNQVHPHDYPHYIALQFAPENRCRRIGERLAEKQQGLTLADMASTHADITSIPARQLLARLGAVQPQTEAGRRAKAVLSAWDARLKAEQAAPLIYNVMRDFLVQSYLEPIVGPLRTEVFVGTGRGGPALLNPWRARLLPQATAEQVAAALDRAAAWLAETLGPDMAGWQWGKLHRLKPVHPLAAVLPDHAERLNLPSSPLDGDGDCVGVAPHTQVFDYTATSSSVARYCFDLSDWDQSGWVVPHGASGHLESPHRADQHQAWLEKRLLPMLYTWARIEAEAESRQTIHA